MHAWLNVALFLAEMVELQASLAKSFPDFTSLDADPTRGVTAFKPHLSVGQWRNQAEADHALQVRPPNIKLDT